MGDKDLTTTKELRSVAVVIPARNESATIADSVRHAVSQNYPGPLEVIVVDGASEDETARIAADTDPTVRVVGNPGRTAPSGMNAGVQATDADIIVRCDGHAMLPTGYVAQAVETLNTTGADNVGGIQRMVGTTPMERAIAAAMSSRFGAGDARFRIGGPAGEVDTVYLGVYRRSTLDRLGGFDTTMVRNQDYELNYRIRRAGGTVWFDPRLSVEYRPRGTISALWRQYFDYGRGKRAMLRRHPESLRLRQTIAPMLVIGLAGSALLAFTPWSWASLIVPGVYAVAVAVATALSIIRQRDGALVRMLAALPTMHLAWGSGLLFGRSLRRP